MRQTGKKELQRRFPLQYGDYFMTISAADFPVE